MDAFGHCTVEIVVKYGCTRLVVYGYGIVQIWYGMVWLMLVVWVWYGMVWWSKYGWLRLAPPSYRSYIPPPHHTACTIDFQGIHRA